MELTRFAEPFSAPESRLAPWQLELRDALTKPAALIEAGVLSREDAAHLADTGILTRSKLRLPASTLALIDPNDPHCPIRLQSVPSLRELDPELPASIQALSERAFGRKLPWTSDPIGDLTHLAAPRITHRYGNRALLHFSASCAMYCRFCFRKEHLSAAEEALYAGPLDPAFAYLARHPEIRELILTGGDPLTHTDARLGAFLDRVTRELPAIHSVRLHSRLASSLPLRLTSELADTLGQDRGFQVHLVSHFNHPRELTAEARVGLRRIARAGVSLWNQNVLLRGVNDSSTTRAELYQALYETGVAPFYLHHADWTPGTFGFRVSIERARMLLRSLKGTLPGPALPDLVVDLPGGLGKVPLLDTERVRSLDETHAWHLRALEAQAYEASQAQARLYEILPPKTRTESRAPRVLYLDAWAE